VRTSSEVILFGLSDDDAGSGYDPAPLLLFDPADITNKIAKYTGVDFAEFEIVAITRDGVPLAALIIEAAAWNASRRARGAAHRGLTWRRPRAPTAHARGGGRDINARRVAGVPSPARRTTPRLH